MWVKLLTVGLVAALALPASAGAQGRPVTVQPAAMRLGPVTDIDGIGRGSFAGARWSPANLLDGRFSIRAEVAQVTEPNAVAGARVNGLAGRAIADLGDLSLAADAECAEVSPRFAVFYDSSGDGNTDGSALYMCGSHPAQPPAPGWHAMSATATRPDLIVTVSPAPPFGPQAIVTDVFAITHAPGITNFDRIGIAGELLGEPGGR